VLDGLGFNEWKPKKDRTPHTLTMGPSSTPERAQLIAAGCKRLRDDSLVMTCASGHGRVAGAAGHKSPAFEGTLASACDNEQHEPVEAAAKLPAVGGITGAAPSASIVIA
jgi:hypothetical protein